ncbi:MAG: 50S ribosomal protein L25/general stress protein Ctc [Rhizobiaceae bacterium]
MSDTYELKAEARERVGKGSARQLRRHGKIPAVIYGDKKPPVAIALSYKDIYYKLHGGAFMTTIATIDVDGDKYRVLPKDYQLDPVRDFPMHVDFLRIGKNTVVTVEIPCHFVGEDKSPGLRRGGVLNVVRYAIELNCPADAIPEHIEVSVEGLDIGDGVHISAVTLPEGAVPTITDRDFTIATVAAPAGLKSEEEEAAEGEEIETEVIGEADEEGESEAGGDEE